jgi:alginate O-acetyltransferase complex protein AlgI
VIFNSIAFAAFFTAFFLLYWLAFNRSLRGQNLLILAASYMFYAWADWRFLPLLVGNSAIFYLLGKAVHRSRSEKVKHRLVLLGAALGLGGLIFFKYTAFLLQSAADALLAFGVTTSVGPLNVLLPLGISFYTFRNLSYLFDLQNGKVEPARDWIVYFSYVAFFPCLVAGPIDRPKTLIPQLESKRVFDYEPACDGLAQVAWGLFKKVVVADNCGVFADEIFAGYRELPGSTLLLGAFFYTMQIYADFSGYSDMALGLSRLLGFTVTRNFDYPFFAQNIAEFWRKWHVSLTSWMTDYVYMPLAIQFRDLGKLGTILAIVVNFTLIGIWHGPNWTFVLFGFLHGCLFIPLVLMGTLGKKRKIVASRSLPTAIESVNMLVTFSMVMLTMVIFRSASVGDAMEYFHRLASPSLFSFPVITKKILAPCTLAFVFLMIVTEWFNRDKPHPLYRSGPGWPKPIRWSFYYAAAVFMFFFAAGGQTFIYGQF